MLILKTDAILHTSPVRFEVKEMRGPRGEIRMACAENLKERTVDMEIYFARRGKNVVARTTFRSGAAIVCLFLSACATVGRDFSAAKVYDIEIGKTTQAEIRAMFGQPWRVGIEDGKPTWTYARYHYSALGETKTKDLVVRFNADNIVRSYTFNTSDPAEVRKE
jgi:hypothetical protein